tara:strand:- start:4505 stop:5293 length:789 start_codon:yes stop_codon:yes gene_type:complete
MSSNGARGMFDRLTLSPTTAKAARTPSTQEAIPGLPKDVVVTHILGAFDDPIYLAHLLAVSSAMRDAVAATGRQVEEVSDEKAAELGYLSTLKSKLRRGCLSLSYDLKDAGLETFDVFLAMNYKGEKDLCGSAAKEGQLEVLKWLRENGCPRNERTFANATLYGHLKVLKWARANGCPWHRETCNAAAGRGHLEVLKWLRENGCPWDEVTCSGAAMGGHLEVLQWLRANECPWDEGTCRWAAKCGKLEVLQWARANGCPWDT